MSKEVREWESLVTSKSEHLARSGSNIRDTAADCQDDEDSSHDRGPSIGLGCNEEGLDEWHDIWVGEDRVHISEAEAECDQHYETKRTVDDNSPHHSARQRDGGILDFLGHLHQLVIIAGLSDELNDSRESQSLGQ
jgi:hypothetical protein